MSAQLSLLPPYVAPPPTAAEEIARRVGVLDHWFIVAFFYDRESYKEGGWSGLQAWVTDRPAESTKAWERRTAKKMCPVTWRSLTMARTSPRVKLQLDFPREPEVITDAGVAALADAAAMVLDVPAAAVRGWLLTGEVQS